MCYLEFKSLLIFTDGNQNNPEKILAKSLLEPISSKYFKPLVCVSQIPVAFIVQYLSVPLLDPDKRGIL